MAKADLVKLARDFGTHVGRTKANIVAALAQSLAEDSQASFESFKIGGLGGVALPADGGAARAGMVEPASASAVEGHSLPLGGLHNVTSRCLE